jgi:hypothetical protein
VSRVANDISGMNPSCIVGLLILAYRATIAIVQAGGSLVDATISGVVKNGLIVPSSPLPEGARVEIRLSASSPELAAGPNAAGMPPLDNTGSAVRLTASPLRKMPREQRQAILAAAAEMAEQDYRSDKELSGGNPNANSNSPRNNNPTRPSA